MAVKKKTTRKKTTATASKAKTKPFRQNSTTGKIVSEAGVKANPRETMTQTVLQDNDGARSDKGKKRAPKPQTTQSEASESPDVIKESVETIENNVADTDWKKIAEDNIAEHGKVTAEEVRKMNEEAGLTGEAVSKAIIQDRTGGDDPNGEINELPCLSRRPTKPPTYTCLDEVQEAIDHPERFTEPQYQDIISDNNLCENCKKRQEAE